MTNPGISGGLPELDRANRNYLNLAKSIANKRLKAEIYPLLEQRLNLKMPPRSWNPLRIAGLRFGDLTMKLFNPQGDPYVREIMRDPVLSARVQKIVTDSLESALGRDMEIQQIPFIAAILRDLMKEESSIEIELNPNGA